MKRNYGNEKAPLADPGPVGYNDLILEYPLSDGRSLRWETKQYMEFKKKKAPASLFAQTKVALLRMIAALEQQGVEKLPAEDELGKQLGVSRMVVRDVMGELETRGYVTRKQGVGTLINRHVFAAQPRVDEQLDFLELIRAAGYTPAYQLLDDRWVDTPDEGVLDDKFHLEHNEGLLFLERSFLGDNRPLVYGRVYIKESIFEVDYSKWVGYQDLSILEFLETFCSKQVHITLAELGLCQADSLLSQRLHISEGTPLLLMRDTGYTVEGEAIVRACSYLCPEVLPVKLARHRI